MNTDKSHSQKRLFQYIAKQKGLITWGIIATLLMSLVDLFTGSLLKFLTKVIGKFSGAFENGFSEGIELPIKYAVEVPLLKDEIIIFKRTLKGNDEIFSGLLTLCLLFLGLFFLLSLFNYGRRVFMNAATQRILLNFKSDIYKKILRLPSGFFAKNKTGDVVSRITYDVNTLSEIIDLFIEVARAGIYTLVFLPFMFAINWKLSILTILFFPTSIIFIEYTTRFIKKVSKKITDNVGDYTAFLEEKINRYQIIKGFRTENREANVFDDMVEQNYKFNLRLIMLKFSMNPTNDFLAMVAIAVVYIIFSYNLTHGGTNFGDIVFYLYLMKTLFKPIKKVAQAWGQLHIALVSTRKIFTLLDAPEENIENHDKTEKLATIEEITFNKVCFKYPDDKRSVLQDISFTANKGDIVCLDGKSGAGKSTLLRLIPNFYKPCSGEISINKMPLDSFSLYSVRENIVHVDSKTLFMNDSIKANIEYCGISMTKEQETEFAKFLGLRQSTDLSMLIGKEGIDLSEGQKQKLAFLRAILPKPKVLILDEAFASLDQQDIHTMLNKCKKCSIIFVVSRKKEVQEYANKIIKLEDGRIME